MVEKINKINQQNQDIINLKKELYQNLEKDFGFSDNLNKKIIKSLLNLKTETGLEGLKSELNKSNLSQEEKNSLQNLSKDKKERLFNVLKGYKRTIEKTSKNELNILKYTLEKGNSQNKTGLKKILPTSILNKLENPNGVGDEVLGIALGTVNSTMTTVEFLYKLGAGIIKSPYHIYLIVSGKAKYEIPNI